MVCDCLFNAHTIIRPNGYLLNVELFSLAIALTVNVNKSTWICFLFDGLSVAGEQLNHSKIQEEAYQHNLSIKLNETGSNSRKELFIYVFPPTSNN